MLLLECYPSTKQQAAQGWTKICSFYADQVFGSLKYHQSTCCHEWQSHHINNHYSKCIRQVWPCEFTTWFFLVATWISESMKSEDQSTCTRRTHHRFWKLRKGVYRSIGCQKFGGIFYRVKPAFQSNLLGPFPEKCQVMRRSISQYKEKAHIWKSELVGGIPIPLKNMTSSIGMMTFPIYEKIIQSCSKPPTSILSYMNHTHLLSIGYP